MTDDVNDLFTGFKPISKGEWKSIAERDLKGAGFDSLVWKTYEGFDVQPFYTPGDIAKIDQPDTTGKHDWITYQEIRVEDETEANKQALTARSLDVNGLLFRIDHRIDINKLLQGISPSEITISFTGEDVPDAVRDYFNYLKENGTSPEEISGFCDCDILGRWITEDAPLDFECVADLVRLTASAPDFKALHVSSEDFINAGSNFTQELAYTLNKAVEYVDQLTESGLEVNEIISNFHFGLCITGDFFFEIAKLRAFRSLFNSMITAYDISGVEIPVLASGSLWSKSRHDHHLNMIRNTTEAMSAILGGADAILIRAHNEMIEPPTPLSHRIAVNISNLLRAESHFDKVDNPVTGTYYVESITNELTLQALSLFKETEEKGGLIKLLKSDEIQRQVEQVRSRKEKDFLDNEFIMVGTNKYQVSEESLEVRSNAHKSHASDGRKLLFPRSLAEVYDKKERITK